MTHRITVDEIIEWVPEGRKHLVRFLLLKLIEAEREEGARLTRERIRNDPTIITRGPT